MHSSNLLFFVYYDCSSVPAPPHPPVRLQGMLAPAAGAASGPPLVDGPDLEAESGANGSSQQVQCAGSHFFRARNVRSYLEGVVKTAVTSWLCYVIVEPYPTTCRSWTLGTVAYVVSGI